MILAGLALASCAAAWPAQAYALEHAEHRLADDASHFVAVALYDDGDRLRLVLEEPERPLPGRFAVDWARAGDHSGTATLMPAPLSDREIELPLHGQRPLFLDLAWRYGHDTFVESWTPYDVPRRATLLCEQSLELDGPLAADLFLFRSGTRYVGFAELRSQGEHGIYWSREARIGSPTLDITLPDGGDRWQGFFATWCRSLDRSRRLDSAAQRQLLRPAGTVARARCSIDVELLEGEAITRFSMSLSFERPTRDPPSVVPDDWTVDAAKIAWKLPPNERGVPRG